MSLKNKPKKKGIKNAKAWRELHKNFDAGHVSAAEPIGLNWFHVVNRIATVA